jgi:chromosome segregation ATPase
MDVEAEIVDIKRRLTALETETKSEQQFSVRLFNLVREVRDDVGLLRSHAMITDNRLVRLEERMDRVEQRLERVEERLSRVEADLGALRSEFNSFRQELPGLIADTMREVLKDMRAR